MIALLALLLTAPAPPHTLALAAGYKAAFTCSGIFNAGQTESQIAADDLGGIYTEYQALIADLPTKIDRSARTVSVSFAADLPSRIAVWRPLLGCTQLPIGAAPGTPVPNLTPDFKQPDLAAVDAAPWPLGDRNAAARLPRRAALDAAVAKAFETRATTAVIILKSGKIVAERYRADYDLHTPQRTWSVAKSLTATLVGRAVQQNRIDPAAPADIPEWRTSGDPRAAITLEQLLRMNSGLHTAGPGNRTDGVYLGGAAVPESAAAMPLEAAPGSHFNYANNDTLLAAYALETRLGKEALGYPFTQLLWPLGMTRTTPETDWQGHFILSSQVWMTARDMGRLALLYSNNGMANGQRLLPENWRAFVTAPAGAQPEPRSRGGYGAGFWLMGAENGLPNGTYAMLGNRGQFAVVVPARGIIVIRRGFDAPKTPFDPVVFTRAILAAMP